MRNHHEAYEQAERGSVCCEGMAMHVETIRGVARLATALLSALETYEDNGCADCREKARGLLSQLRRVEVEPDDDEVRTSPYDSPRFTG